MHGGVALRPARRVGAVLVAFTILALIISTALAHLIPLQSVDGASHVAGITNPVSDSSAELPGASDDNPAPAHHDHFEIDHDGTVPTRTVDAVGIVTEVPQALSQLVANPERGFAIAPLNYRVLSGPSLAALSISRT